MRKTFIGFAAFLLLWCSIMPVYAQNGVEPPVPVPGNYDNRNWGPSGDAMIGDLIFVRPLSIVSIAVGLAAAIVATPFALAAGNTSAVYGTLVKDPSDFAFCRPLGTGF
jgi:hypothetical protein